MKPSNCFCGITICCYIASLVLGILHFINEAGEPKLGEIAIYVFCIGFMSWILKVDVKTEESRSSKVHPMNSTD